MCISLYLYIYVSTSHVAFSINFTTIFSFFKRFLTPEITMDCF